MVLNPVQTVLDDNNTDLILSEPAQGGFYHGPLSKHLCYGKPTYRHLPVSSLFLTELIYILTTMCHHPSFPSICQDGACMLATVRSRKGKLPSPCLGAQGGPLRNHVCWGREKVRQGWCIF